ncbi:MAG TPA: hypothetical protein VI756_30795 [Blastocatellia bacterium]
MNFCILLLTLLTSLGSQQAQMFACEPGPEIRSALEQANSVNATGPGAIDVVLPALASLRDRYPNDLFVHEAYQDAVVSHGVQGHLKTMRAEYRVLSTKHPGDPVYRYLYLRSLLGGGTGAAAAGLNQMLTDNPNFSPAIRTLAEIYDTGIFRDAEKEKAVKERLASLCAGKIAFRKLDVLPDKSPLLDQAEKALARGDEPDHAIALATKALTDDEWRGYRIRLLDWYSKNFKTQAVRDLRFEYIRAWAIQVRSQRKAGHPEKAGQVLSQVEQAVASMSKGSDPSYWEGLNILASLYLENKQLDLANETLNRMQQLLDEQPNDERASMLGRLRQVAATVQK